MMKTLNKVYRYDSKVLYKQAHLEHLLTRMMHITALNQRPLYVIKGTFWGRISDFYTTMFNFIIKAMLSPD